VLGKGMVAAGVLAAVVAGSAEAASERRAGSTFDAPLAERVGKAMSVEVTDVACPERVTITTRRAFHCTMTFGTGDVSRVRVRIKNRAGDFSWALTGVLLRDLENHMERAMAESGDPGDVQCPWRRRVRVGDTFRCFGLNKSKTKAWNIDATQIGGGLVRYAFTLRP